MRAMAVDSLGMVPAYTVRLTRFSVTLDQEAPIDFSAPVHGEFSGASVPSLILTGLGGRQRNGRRHRQGGDEAERVLAEHGHFLPRGPGASSVSCDPAASSRA